VAGIDTLRLEDRFSAFTDQLKRTTPAARKFEGMLNRVRLWDVATRTAGFSLESYEFYTEWGRRFAADGGTDPEQHWMFRNTPYLAYDGPARTIFTPTLRYFSVAPEAEAALPIARDALVQLRAAAQALNAELVVALIPTKEQVYAPYLAAQGVELPFAFTELLRRADAVTMELQRIAQDAGIPWIDLSPAMQDATTRGEKLYLESRSGHPKATGHAVIAAALMRSLDP